MNFLDPVQTPYLIVLAAAILVPILVVAFRRYRKPIDKADQNDDRYG
jgi:hypothetical protein